ncbi:MAG TPA: proline dehydrogenase family protein [Gemmatimonadaceae bacterium]|nr:proline dehydrogenase family protein [Gemmatimonadaceae bacterium]
MSIARNVLLRASRSRWLAERFMRRPFARRAVKRFMPGEELSDALGAAKELAPSRIGVVITRLGEALTGESQADAVRDHYLGAYDIIKRERLPVVVSVKPTQLGIDLSFDGCLAHLETLAAKAVESGSQLWIDMEDSPYVDRTLDLYRKVRSKYEPIGLAIQAYLHRTAQDVDGLMDLKPMIRLVKGAYAEPPHIAFPAKKDVDLNYIAVAERLLEAASRGAATPIFGTHDLSIIQHLIGRAGQLKLDKNKYEIHMLYGIRMQEQRRLASEGHAVKCLISYGEKWFPWYMRRLAERPANVWFVMRSAFMN